jgi:hypothetical protein
MGFKILPVKKTHKFNGKVYKWVEYVAMRREAEDKVRQLRYQGKAARYTPQPGYGQGGWNIWVRG